MTLAVICTATETQADSIIRSLKASGFTDDDISVLVSDKRGATDLSIQNSTKAPEGAVTGYGTGFAIGGTIGLLAGIGALAIPGIGPFIAAGPIMAALGGAAIGGVVGTVTGALVGMGVPEYEAKKYEGKLKAGSTLVSVHSSSDEQTARAKKIFQAAGAEDISTAGELAVSEVSSERTRM
ncbi:conserved hypothetical protein [Pirellula staleyi DSM 6068]|uniref:DUF3341 domain-containing protein n=1 Tax=Pirellula staleyi (strain ATCC 27377 / DSM 6068 / ICPB 4128) TaxID=530564 RepID=D2R6D4_PIRSD|nr:hypothetical protein [Pirellula staleyi]ADB15512.1 conserved hypothetical protein [Pirellula staleyi DSM 6068]